jgi:hypothetical protein
MGRLVYTLRVIVPAIRLRILLLRAAVNHRFTRGCLTEAR